MVITISETVIMYLLFLLWKVLRFFLLVLFLNFYRGVNYITWEHKEELFQEDEVCATFYFLYVIRTGFFFYFNMVTTIPKPSLHGPCILK